MKKIKVLFMVIFVLLFASCGKPREVNITDTEIREGITYVKGETKAFTGIIKSYYENGNLESEGNFKDGKLEGLSKLYYENGILQIEVSYKNGKIDGIMRNYYKNGDLIAEHYYKDGKKIY